MTRKEIIENIKEIRSLLPEIGDPPDEWLHALDLAISALLPWKKLSEEKPTRNDWYWVYDISQFRDSPIYLAFWNNYNFRRNMIISPTITHWCELVGPEEDSE